jgi:hypothetical protein
MRVRFDDDFDVVDWYTTRFRRSPTAPSTQRLHEAVAVLTETRFLQAGWELFPPGVPTFTESERSAWHRVLNFIEAAPEDVNPDEFAVCWLEANRRAMFDRLAEIRKRTPVEMAIAIRDGHLVRASTGFREAVGFVSEARPEMFDVMGPVLLAYAADLLARCEIWIMSHSEGEYWTGSLERQQMQFNSYRPPSRLGRESTLWLEGRVYTYRPEEIYGPDGVVSQEEEDSLREITSHYWSEIQQLLIAERGCQFSDLPKR